MRRTAFFSLTLFVLLFFDVVTCFVTPVDGTPVVDDHQICSTYRQPVSVSPHAKEDDKERSCESVCGGGKPCRNFCDVHTIETLETLCDNSNLAKDSTTTKVTPAQCFADRGFEETVLRSFTSTDGWDVVIANFDADSIPDVIGMTQYPNGLEFFKGQGNGAFASSVGIGGSHSPGFIRGAAAGLMDGDAFVDVVVVSLDVGVSLYINDGSAGFTGSTIAGGALGGQLALGDVDGDNDLDILYSESFGSNPAFVRNNGGSWAIQTVAFLPGTAIKTALADVDGDNFPDVLVAMQSPGKIAFVSNTGPGGDGTAWATAVDLVPTADLIGQNVVAIDGGDLDGDGDNDVVYGVSGGSAEHYTALLLNDGTGTVWTRAATTFERIGTRDLTTVDWDGDGRVDIIRLTSASNSLELLHLVDVVSSDSLAHLAYTLVPQEDAGVTKWAVGPISPGGSVGVAVARNNDLSVYTEVAASYVAAPLAPLVGSTNAVHTVDIDADGDLDIVYAGGSYVSVPNIWIHHNVDGRGSFSAPQPVGSILTPISTLGLGDLDGDGDWDLCVRPDTAVVVCFLNLDGSGTSWSGGDETDPFSSGLGDELHMFVLADLNNDTAADLVTATATSSYPSVLYVSVALSFGNGTFGPVLLQTQFDSGSYGIMFAADVDNNGLLDIVYNLRAGSISEPTLLLNVGNGSLVLDAHVVSTLPNSGWKGTAADFNGDNVVDFLIRGNYRLRWYEGPGFAEHVVTDSAPNTGGICVADADGDGDADIYLQGASSGSYDLLLYTNPYPATTTWVSTTVGSSLSPTAMSVADLDADGDLDIVIASYQGSTTGVYLASLSSIGSLPTPQTRSVSPASCASQGIPFTSAMCYAHVAAGASLCVRDTVEFTPGTYGCRLSSHTTITRPVAFASSTPSAAVTFDCASASGPDDPVGGVAFLVTQHPSFPTQAGDVEASSMTFTNMGVARRSVSGTPGLRVEGSHSRLALSSVTISTSMATTTAEASLADAGYGGAVLALGGASLQLTNVTVSDCSAALAGGAVAIRQPGTTLSIANSLFERNSAASGGALAASDGATAVITPWSVVTDNSATGSGGGGGIAVDTLSRVVGTGLTATGNVATTGPGGAIAVALRSDESDGSRVICTGCTLSGNYGVVGGGIAAAPASLFGVTAISATHLPAAVELAYPAPSAPPVLMVNAAISGNSARYGGGLFACGGWVGITGGASLLGSNTATRGSSGDGFVCAAQSVVGGTPARSGGMLPWLALHTDVEAALAGAAIHTQPAGLSWVSSPPGQTPAGVTFAATLGSVDWLGQDVVYSGVSADVAFDPAPEMYAANTGSVLLASPAVSLPDLTVALVDSVLESAPVEAQFTVSASGPQSGGGSLPVAPLLGTISVGPCPAGYGAAAGAMEGTTVCAQCPLGTTAPGTSFDPCRGLGDCPANTARPLVLTNGTECSCLTGFWSPSGALDEPCFACPTGGLCAGGLSQPVALPGFYSTGDGNKFLRCRRKSACKGGGRIDAGSVSSAGGTIQCEAGYTGFLCNGCSDGYFSNAALECVECPNAPAALFGASFVFLLSGSVLYSLFVAFSASKSAKVASIALMVAGMRKSAGRKRANQGVAASSSSLASEEEEEEEEEAEEATTELGGTDAAAMEAFRKRTLPGSIAILTVVFQVLGIVGGTKFNWPSSTESTLQTFNIANVDASYFASECALGTFHTKYKVSVALPVAVVFIVIGACALAWAVSLFALRKRTTLWAVCGSALFAVGPLSYIPISKAAITIFDCVQLANGDWAIDSNPGVACFDSAWIQSAIVGGVVLVFFSFGLPIGFAWTLVRHRHGLADQAVFSTYGDLYRQYRIPYYLGGVADLTKRLVIVLVATFASEHIISTVLSLLALFLLALTVITLRAPYYLPLYNALELRTTSVIIAVLLLGFGSYAERNTSGRTEGFIDGAVIFVLVILGIVSVHAVIVDVLDIVYTRKHPGTVVNARTAALASVILKDVQDVDADFAEELEDLAVRLKTSSSSKHRTQVVPLNSDSGPGSDSHVGYGIGLSDEDAEPSSDYSADSISV